MKFEGKMTNFDFSSLNNMPGIWPLGSKLSEINNTSTLHEIPIATAKCGISEQLRFTRLKKARKNPVYPENSGVEFHHKESTGIIEKFKRYILPAYRMLDFTSGSTCEEMIFITEKYIEKAVDGDPIIAISHPKNFALINEFNYFLNFCQNHFEIKFEEKNKNYYWR